jgi:polar amino acid transport system substrate-binding protein
LKIGIDDNYEPYTYVDENGDYTGLDIELAKEACREMGRNPVFVAIKWDNKNDYLENGTIDCIWSCFSMDGREDEYDWAGPYMYSRQVVAVRSDSEIKTLADMKGKTVAVMSSTKPESIFLERENDKIPDVKNVYCMADMDLVFTALKLNYVDAAAGHESVIQQYIQTESGQYRLLDDALLAGKVGVAFEKGKNTELCDALKDAMETLQRKGTLQTILGEYGIRIEDAEGGAQ